jgi:hypothetical protein
MKEIINREEYLEKVSICITQQLVHVRASVQTHQTIHKDIIWPDFIVNAVILTFALHNRNLCDFFYSGKQTRRDDLKAEDFFEDHLKWKKICPAQTQNLADNIKKFNKHLAHLTKLRLNKNEDDDIWDFQRILEDLALVLYVFINNIEKKYSEIFEPEINNKFWQILFSKALKNHNR